MAEQAGGRKGLSRSAGTFQGFAGGADCVAARGNSRSRRLEHEQRQSGEVESHGAGSRIERKLGEEPGGREADAGAGGDFESAGSVEESGKTEKQENVPFAEARAGRFFLSRGAPTRPVRKGASGGAGDPG